MLPLADISRRALIAILGIAALPHDAEGKKRRRKPKPPLASLSVVITSVNYASGAADVVSYNYQARFQQPSSGVHFGYLSTIDLPGDSSAQETRSRIAAELRAKASTDYEGAGGDGPLPPDRIEVTLF